MKSSLSLFATKVFTFTIIVIAILSKAVYSQTTCQVQKFSGIYKRVDRGIYTEFRFLDNGSAIVYEDVSGLKYNGSYYKKGDEITIRFQQLNGGPFTVELQQDDDNTLVQKVSLLRHKYVKESNTRKKVLSKRDVLGKWKIKKSETKNSEGSIEMLSWLLIVTGASMTFTDDGNILDSDGKIAQTYYIDGEQLFIDGKNAPYEFACLNGEPVLKITTEDEKKENVFNIVHLRR
jgi:hypothetical protein